MFFHQRFVPGLAIASYLVGDEKSKRLAVIDPPRDVEEFIRIAKTEGMQITDILETHVHADFVSGARELKARLNNQPTIHCSGMGGEAWTPAYADHIVKDGDELSLGASLRLRAMHTPGHTPEHVTWALFDNTRSADTPWLLFTGDFVFVGDVGRPDLLGDDERKKLAHQLYESLFSRLTPLPDFTEIFPSHGAGSLCGKAIGSRRSSSLGFERRFNASMQKRAEGDWSNALLKGMPPAPPYFKRMKRINRDGPPILGADFRADHAIAPHDLKSSERTVLDVRDVEAFATAHIAGAISIPMGPQFATWAGWMLDPEKAIVLVANSRDDVNESITQLLRVGFDRIDGFVDGGVDAWRAAGLEIEMLNTISASELATKLRSTAPPFVIDVRTDGEWESGHIDSAQHIQAGFIAQSAKELPRDREIALICGSGYRSTVAASMLARGGFKNITNVRGGMSAWNASKKELATDKHR